MYCIYRITNKINGHFYIGQHKYTDESNPMGKYKGSGVLLHRAYKKYGEENFETEILYKRIRDKSTVDAMEIWSIEKYKPEYNIAKGGSGGNTWDGLCEEAKERMREKCSHIHNFKEFNSNPELITKRVATHKKNHPKGSYHLPPMSEEAKRKISEARKGKPAWNKGRKMTNKQRASWRGPFMDKSEKDKQKICDKISKSKIGKKWYTNGEISVFAYECPEGFIPGRIMKSMKKETRK